MGLLDRVARRSSKQDLRARIAGADPIDPGVPVPSAPWAADVRPARGVRAARLEALPPRLDADARRAGSGGRGARGRAQGRRRRGRRRSTTRSSRGSSRRAGGSSGSGTATPIGAEAFEVAKDVVLVECTAEGGITLGRFRDLVGTGRRDAQLLLERLDADGVTRRVGERRVLRRAATGLRAGGLRDRSVRAGAVPRRAVDGGRHVVDDVSLRHSGSSSIPTPSATRVT